MSHCLESNLVPAVFDLVSVPGLSLRLTLGKAFREAAHGCEVGGDGDLGPGAGAGDEDLVHDDGRRLRHPLRRRAPPDGGGQEEAGEKGDGRHDLGSLDRGLGSGSASLGGGSSE